MELPKEPCNKEIMRPILADRILGDHRELNDPAIFLRAEKENGKSKLFPFSEPALLFLLFYCSYLFDSAPETQYPEEEINEKITCGTNVCHSIRVIFN